WRRLGPHPPAGRDAGHRGESGRVLRPGRRRPCPHRRRGDRRPPGPRRRTCRPHL
ncbi:uncharacterized protein METZ01_LOCUS428498, partial [marine metagenome]